MANTRIRLFTTRKPTVLRILGRNVLIYTALKDGTVHAIYHEVFWTKANKPFPIEYISTPIRKNGVVVGTVVTFTDRIKCDVAREALQVFANNPRAATEFSEWCVGQKKKKEIENRGLK